MNVSGPWRRAQVHGVVALARLLARRPPGRIRAVLVRVSRGARPAGYADARAAREAVTAVSPACGRPEACLPLSLATVLLCRLGGAWPTWCVGVRTLPPFGAHAWVEAEGRAVGEPHPPGYFQTFFTVP
ncbi:lasso peptide biosynthesis B2 protein [Streptomyces vilmorinianum]|uniref:lasso peptide biosynthesis B2 protein n=1 Tax=Streptomyces vilmorinianum TaxID=3051092 RepID=UPI0010FB4C89|nr:lasso peptide biosynthesis B2 protein [Streptomyces vilmorinianum]